MDLTDITLLKGLQNLLRPASSIESLSDSGDDLPGVRRDTVTASTSTQYYSKPSSDPPLAYQNPYQPLPTSDPSSRGGGDDWDNDDDAEDLSNVLNPLPVPEYEIIYKQRVNTEDVYLQMGNKNPSTASCEDLVIKVHLRDDITESASQMQLEIEERKISMRTKSYVLNLPLPHPINPDQGSAKWDASTEIFTITLRRKFKSSFD